ncbi:LysR family transcriptional regulator [Nocardioides anomalus]|uniref:LysR family transcriptional regulator n=1 Tax=Nocardioides anomalus TaxID=2712223 RepID=A0A6G6WC67_9ACTN|nr:LysR family transcriptional regulator [Nocardioides anomalus]QIG42743.1 LysR family transcriptional regulator [Nocardioides anomalus]
MELHQLRYLVAVVEDGSFTAAAQRLHVSQSGVSAQVAKLEHELGQRLLERGPRSLALTAAGEAVLPLARAVLEGVAEIAEVSAAYAGAVRGRVRLGMVRGCSIPPFLDALAAFRREHPGVELALAEDDSEVLQRHVLGGELDLALVGWAGDVLEGLSATVVVDEPVAAVVPDGHRLAGHRTVRWRDLEGETLLGLVRGTGVRAAVDLSGLERPVDLEASSPETLLGLTRRGAGVALLSPSMVRGEDGVHALVVADAEVTATLGLVAREGRRPAATERLLDRLVQAMT